MNAKELAQALIAHASAYLPGDETLDMKSVRDIVLTMAEDPVSKIALGRELAVVNDPETVGLVKSLIERVVSDLEQEARNNGQKISVVLQPWQTASISIMIAGSLAAAAGTIALAWAFPLIAASAGMTAISSALRNKSATVENDLTRKAALVKALL
ncbi:hypothetical protein KUV57_12375 [Epibacterium sp. DP7N7-1]|nr:hypothetical protein [Epibacterium sp. DP7N7-1]